MKKLTVCLILAAFALLPIARGGDAKSTDKTKTTSADKSACCADKSACAAKAKTSADAKTACSAKSACCADEKAARKVANPDAKGATFLVKR